MFSCLWFMFVFTFCFTFYSLIYVFYPSYLLFLFCMFIQVKKHLIFILLTLYFYFLLILSFLYTHFCFWLNYFYFCSYTEGIVGCLGSRKLILLLTSKKRLADIQLQGNCWGISLPKVQLITSSMRRRKTSSKKLQTARA